MATPTHSNGTCGISRASMPRSCGSTTRTPTATTRIPATKRRFYLDAIDRAAYVGGTAPAAQEVVGLEKRKKWGSGPSGLTSVSSQPITSVFLPYNEQDAFGIR